MSLVDVRRKAHVYPFHFLWEDDGAGSESYCEEFCLQFAHSL